MSEFEVPSLLNITIDDIANGLDARRFTSVDLVRAYLARIEEVNERFKAVLEVNPDALAIAVELDKELSRTGRRGPLHGVPILIKDNLCTLDKLNTTAGSYVLLGSKAPRESKVVVKLREAGAVILGTANLSEWGNVRGNDISGGWSPRGGQCLGVYSENMTPAGSSSGPGVATALGLAVACIGTETSGSICSPSEKNNVVGIKPTTGLVSRDCVIPVSDRMDTVGPMARNVKDAAYILQAIAGKCEFDKRTQSIPFDKVPKYALACASKRLDGIRIGSPENTYGEETKRPVTQPVLTALREAVEVLKDAGAIFLDYDGTGCKGVEEHRLLPKEQRLKGMLVDLKSGLKDFLGNLKENSNNVHTLSDVIEWTKSDPEEEYPDKDIGMFEMAENIPTPTEEEYKLIVEKDEYFAGEGGILGFMDRNKLDALAVPGMAQTACDFAARGGLPIVVVPLGFYPEGTDEEQDDCGLVEVAENVPFSISFIGRAYSEETLIRIAYAFEQMTNHRLRGKLIQLPRMDLVDILNKSARGLECK